MAGLKHPVTPDGRYFVVRSKLWRMANPNLTNAARSELAARRPWQRLAKASPRL